MLAALYQLKSLAPVQKQFQGFMKVALRLDNLNDVDLLVHEYADLLLQTSPSILETALKLPGKYIYEIFTDRTALDPQLTLLIAYSFTMSSFWTFFLVLFFELKEIGCHVVLQIIVVPDVE